MWQPVETNLYEVLMGCVWHPAVYSNPWGRVGKINKVHWRNVCCCSFIGNYLLWGCLVLKELWMLVLIFSTLQASVTFNKDFRSIWVPWKLFGEWKEIKSVCCADLSILFTFRWHKWHCHRHKGVKNRGNGMENPLTKCHNPTVYLWLPLLILLDFCRSQTVRSRYQWSSSWSQCITLMGLQVPPSVQIGISKAQLERIFAPFLFRHSQEPQLCIPTRGRCGYPASFFLITALISWSSLPLSFSSVTSAFLLHLFWT